jgi:hypothetical protein
VDLLAQPSLGTNAEAVADEQHPYHQLWINRGSTDEPINSPQHVIVGNVPF